jgi:hypothetical protein
MIFRPFYAYETGCACYLFGCGGKGLCAVVDPQEKDVDAYVAFATEKAMRITHVVRQTSTSPSSRSTSAT